MVNGFTDINKEAKFTDDPLVMKPQWFHSSLAIYLLLTYPSMKPPNSFIDELVGKCESEILKIATDVLSSDDDGRDIVEHPELYFGSTVIDNNKGKNVAIQIPTQGN